MIRPIQLATQLSPAEIEWGEVVTASQLASVFSFELAVGGASGVVATVRQVIRAAALLIAVLMML